MKMKAEVAAALIAALTIVFSGFGWILSLENRITSKASSAELSTEIDDAKKLLRKEMDADKEALRQSVRDLKTELDTDIRIMRDRMYQQQALPQYPQTPTP